MGRGNAVVQSADDKYRDTVALTVRGDGVDIPPFIIVHKSKNASKASGRKCAEDENPIKGMNSSLMIDYVNHISNYVREPSLLLLDRLSSHTAAAVRLHIESKLTRSGERLLYPIYLPPKTSFLISPLDMGAIAAFKSNFYKLDRSSLELKLNSVREAWDKVSNDSLRSICTHCGIVGDRTLDTLRPQFMDEVIGSIPEKLEKFVDYYDAWEAEAIEIEGVTRRSKKRIGSPMQLEAGYMDGDYWTNYRRRNSP